jgi:4-amino-4-deoxy-L-arabinose transferase-like glycosyltransferase
VSWDGAVQVETASETPTRGPRGQRDGRSRRGIWATGLVLIALAGFAIRLGYVLAGAGNDTSQDGLYYHFAANVLVDGRGFVNPWEGGPIGQHPPAWPVLLGLPSLVGLDGLLAHQVFACIVGTVAILLVAMAGRAMLGARVALVAAALAAANPNMWVRERELLGQTLVFPLTAVALVLAYRYWRTGRSLTLAAVGGVCGLLALVHASLALLLAMLLPILALRAAPGLSLARRLRQLVAALSVAILVLLPWIVRNTVQFDRPMFLTTTLGLNLRVGTCPAGYYGERIGSHDPDMWRPRGAVGPDQCGYDAASRNEVEQDDVFRADALAYMRENAGRVPIVAAARQGRIWGVFRPFQTARFDQEFGGGPLSVYQAGVVFYWALLPVAVVGAWRLRRSPVSTAPLLPFFAVAAASAAIAFGTFRYRAPAEVPIVLLAAVGVDALWTRLRSHDRRADRNASTTSSDSASVMSV